MIIPTYNNGRFINDAISSVLSQSVPVYQIIVIDDGSTDNTRDTILSIEDERLVYRQFQNAGVSVARNRGLALATAEFVAFLDGDDMWRPTMVEKQLAILTADSKIVCSFTNFRRFLHDTGTQLSQQFHFYPDLPHVSEGVFDEQEAFSKLVMFDEIPALTQVMMFRREAILDLRFDPNLHICEDMAFALQVFAKGKVAFTRELLADVRQHDGNATRGRLLEVPFNKLAALVSIKDRIGPAHSEAFQERLTKAFIDSAVQSVALGSPSKGIRYLLQAWRSSGKFVRKAKGTARFAWAACSRLQAPQGTQ